MTFEDDLLALERRVLIGAGGDFLTAVAALRRMLAAQTPGIGGKLARLAIPQMEAIAKAGVLEGWTAGGARAAASAEAVADVNTVGDARLRLDTIPDHLTAPLNGLDALLVDAKRRSVVLLESGAPIEAALAPIFGAATTARSRITTQINAASNTASLTVGDAVRSPMVWEAERDACVYCLALSGHVVETPGDPFPPADLYAEPPASAWTVSMPPLHPYCRCRLAVLADRSYADALRREAQRSVLRGFSLQSESQAVRVKAAQRLLDRDPVAPKSVKQYAAAAVKRGHFPTRDVPKGDPRLIITDGPGHGIARPPEPPRPAPQVVPAPAAEPHRFIDVADMKAFGERMGGPSKANAKAVTEYTSGTSGDINSTLRGGRSKYTSSKVIDATVKGVDEEMRVSSVPEDIIVYRGAPLAAFKDKNPDTFIGKVVSDKAYLSTSMARDVSAIGKGQKVHLEIRVPKGSRAIYAAGVSKYKAEKELLIDRDSGLAIESAVFNERTQKWRVVATLVQKPKK